MTESNINSNINNINSNNNNNNDNRINDNNHDSNNMNNNNSNNNNSNGSSNRHERHSILKLHIPETNPQKPSAEEPKHHVKPKKKRRDKSDLGENFVAPDGGWGWLVSIAAGVNVLVTFAVAQQFGIIFRERMANLGISSSELTTIINTQIAVSAFTGLLNGPLFRRYTFRAVAVFGSVLTFIGLFLSVFAASFLFYIMAFSLIYGFGRGLTVSASSLAVNTYFKQKRRTATAYQFGVAGIGPIILPYVATYMLQIYGVQGTVLIFSAISLHTISCSLIYQPVKWHVKKLDKDAEALNKPAPEEHEQEDVIDQIVEPETPTLPRANDGWFGSRHSLNTTPTYRSRNGSLVERGGNLQMVELKRLTSRDYGKPRSISVSHSIKEEDHEHSESNSEHFEHEPVMRKKSVEEVLKTPTAELHQLDEEERKALPFYKKVIIFFDLDLLRDFTYLNLAVGLTLINFVEINFAILTPFILADFGYEKDQIALAMSLLGFCDLVIRFLVPVLTAKFNFSNKTFFIIGILGMCLGRFVITVTHNFYIMIAAFLWMGLNKAFRTVFWSLIIPGYVPLKRLPAAAGLQLLMSGIFSMAFGPLIGLIRDYTNYAFTLNFLNMLCIAACLMWILEAMYRKRQNKSKPVPSSDQ